MYVARAQRETGVQKIRLELSNVGSGENVWLFTGSFGMFFKDGSVKWIPPEYRTS